VVASA
jgi:hypothetical protein